MVHNVIVIRDNLHLYFLHRMSRKKYFYFGNYYHYSPSTDVLFGCGGTKNVVVSHVVTTNLFSSSHLYKCSSSSSSTGVFSTDRCHAILFNLCTLLVFRMQTSCLSKPHPVVVNFTLQLFKDNQNHSTKQLSKHDGCVYDHGYVFVWVNLQGNLIIMCM